MKLNRVSLIMELRNLSNETYDIISFKPFKYKR